MNSQNLRPIRKPGSGGFRPGSGRKPLPATQLKEKLGDFAFDAIRAFKFCAALMDDENAEKPTRLAAAREVMDRLWGKPTQKLAGDDGGPIKIELVKYANPS